MCGWISLLQTTNKFVNLQGELHNEKTDDSDARHGVRFHYRGCCLRPGHHQEGRDRQEKVPQEEEERYHQELGLFPPLFCWEAAQLLLRGHPACSSPSPSLHIPHNPVSLQPAPQPKFVPLGPHSLDEPTLIVR